MANGFDLAIGVLAARQLGVFSRAEARSLGADDKLISRRLAQGRWIRLAPGVYGLPGVPESFDRRVWIALLGTSPLAVVSFQTAAAYHRYAGFPEGRIVLTVPHGGHHRIDGAFVHQISDVLPHHLTIVRGMPCTTPERTAVDLAAVCSFPRLFESLDDARVKGRVDVSGIGVVLRDVARRGKPGMAKIARVLDKLEPGKVPSQSVLERKLHDLLEMGGEPPLVRQYPHPGRDLPAACVDGAYVEAKLIVEVDGRRWHTRIADLKRDHDRDNEAGRAGWFTLRLLYEDVVGDPEGQCTLIRQTRLMRLAQLAA